MIELEDLKQHCRIDGNEEDRLLQGYLDAAVDTLATHTGRNWYDKGETIPASDPTGLHLQGRARQAVLLLAATWYAGREADGQTALPEGFYRLIQPYRIYGL